MANELKVRLRQISASATGATVGSHEVVIDRPVAKGGTDQGPMGGELFLAAVGGCFMSNLLAAMRARGLEWSGIQAEVTGSIADFPARFDGIDLTIRGGGADSETLRHLVEVADRGCIMMNTLRGKLEVRIRIAGSE